MTGPRLSKQDESFSRFYLRQVAISEGCGCAELVIRRESQKAGEGRSPSLLAALLSRLFRGRESNEANS